MKIKFPVGEMLEIISEESEDSELIEDVITDTSRWSIHHNIVFKKDNRFYSTWYSEGATEYQDERPWDSKTEVECTEVRPVETKKIVYQPV